MATYNGGAFLREQLRSITAQEPVRWRLLWRDDGSTDDTTAIMGGFAACHPAGQVEQVAGPSGRVGASASFLALLRHAAPGMEAQDLVAFADQDDVWLPGKLSRAAAAIAGCDAAVPTLYSARQVLVDAGLNRLALSAPIRPPPGFPASLTQNLATGCTVVMNRAAARLVAGSTAPSGCQHDWWAYIVVTAAGGRFLIDGEPVVLYRQHPGNLVGAPPTLVQRGIAAVRRGPGVFMGVLRQNVAALDAQRHLLAPAACRELDLIKAGLDGNAWQKLRALRRPGLKRQTWAEQMLFRLWFLVG